jgi:DNA-binding MarR family transcriptional regulator
MAETRWLGDDEQRTWRKLVAVLMKLPAALESQLQRDADMSHFEYWVLAILSDSPERSRRLSMLAAQANSSLSRLSHVITRLEKKGYVNREPCPDNTRAMLAVLTDTGHAKLAESAPGHVEAVRTLVFDGLSPDQLNDLDRACTEILARIGGPDPVQPRTGVKGAAMTSPADDAEDAGSGR